MKNKASLKLRLEYAGFRCQYLVNFDNWTAWIVAVPPEGLSWQAVKEEVWYLTKNEYGILANVREQDNHFLIEISR